MPRLELGWKTGLEPATLGITIRCSNQLSYIHQCKTTLPSPPCPPGAPGRTRTCNRRLRRPVLYPVELRAPGRNDTGLVHAASMRIAGPGQNGLVGAEGFEPTTSSSQSWRSTRLSYTPAVKPTPEQARRRSLTVRGRRLSAQRAWTGTSEQKGCRSTLFALVARPERFELPTTKFVAWCSIQLSYGRAEAKLWGTTAKPSILS